MPNKKSNVVKVYSGLDGYIKPLLKRIEVGESPIRQIINGELVADFHQMTGDLVKQVISTRVKKGLTMRNLIRREDQSLAIELSNPDTLKETRLLPKEFKDLKAILAVFGDTVALSSLDKSDQTGIIITNKTIAAAFRIIFDTIWERSTPR